MEIPVNWLLAKLKFKGEDYKDNRPETIIATDI